VRGPAVFSRLAYSRWIIGRTPGPAPRRIRVLSIGMSRFVRGTRRAFTFCSRSGRSEKLQENRYIPFHQESVSQSCGVNGAHAQGFIGQQNGGVESPLVWDLALQRHKTMEG